jgi:mRNA interferase MazF
VKGSIYRLKHSRDARGHEQHGTRFAVVVQATRFEHLSRWAVVPTSSSPNARPGALHPVIDWGEGPSVVLCDGVESVDPQKRLGDEVGFVSLTQLQQIDRALAFLFDLP